MKLLFPRFQSLTLGALNRPCSNRAGAFAYCRGIRPASHANHEQKSTHVQEIQINKDVVLRRNQNEADHKKPLVLLFGWGNGKLSYLKKYSELYESRGYTTILSRSYLVDSLVFPASRAKPAVSKMLHALQPHLPQPRGNPVIVQCFSNAGIALQYFFSNLLADPSGPHHNVFDIRGVVFDSCPVMPDLKSVFPTLSAFSEGVSNPFVKGIMIATLLTVIPVITTFNPTVKRFRALILSDTLLYPQLYLYSKSDRLADFRFIESVANRRNAVSGMVRQKVWEDTPHCQHFRMHPKEYEAEIDQFLKSINLK